MDSHNLFLAAAGVAGADQLTAQIYLLILSAIPALIFVIGLFFRLLAFRRRLAYRKTLNSIPYAELGRGFATSEKPADEPARQRAMQDAARLNHPSVRLGTPS
jgi:hypothetical protein